jgi:hypothetical protein
MDTSADSHDNSLGAETSHAAPEERDTTPTSPARELRDAFYKDDEGSLEDEDESLALNIAMMSGRLSLADHDIVDEAQDGRLDPGIYRYRVASRLLRKIIQVTRDLQWFLSEAAKLNSHRRKFFRVDPGDVLLPSLEGASDPQQIRVAWDLLRARMELGKKFFDKYLREYSEGRRDSASPTSTRSSVIEGYESLQNNEQKLKHLITYYPHHKDDLPSAQERVRTWGTGWGPLYERRATSLSPRREERMPEAEESVVIPSDTSNVTQHIGKQRESWPDNKTMTSQEFAGDRSIFSPVPSQLSALEMIQAKAHPSPLKPPAHLSRPGVDTTLLGPSLKFKSSTAFLDQMAGQSSISVGAVPNATVQPNILDNLLAGPMGSKGDVYRSTFGENEGISVGNLRGQERYPSGSWRDRRGDPYVPRPSSPLAPSVIRPPQAPIFPTPLDFGNQSSTVPSFAPPAATYVPPPLRSDRYEEQKMRSSTPPTTQPISVSRAPNPRFRY